MINESLLIRLFVYLLKRIRKIAKNSLKLKADIPKKCTLKWERFYNLQRQFILDQNIEPKSDLIALLAKLLDNFTY